MMSKRKTDDPDDFLRHKIPKVVTPNKKYSLDSDEEDDTQEDDVLDENDIEGEEDGVPTNYGEERFTAFNMREEMEEGHFDKEGHFIWKNEKEVRDNWLDNIDWQKLKSDGNAAGGTSEKGLGDESDDDDEELFQEVDVYRQILTYMKPRETINKALRRLGEKNKNLSSIERIRRKKAGILDSSNEVIELTELADKILSFAGNMDIYQETYEQITQKIARYENKNNPQKSTDAELDMYADDFSTREEAKLTSTNDLIELNAVQWEFKWKVNDEKVEGPYDTQQMLKWANEGYFKDGVFVRKCKEDDRNFYSSNRIDFELYL